MASFVKKRGPPCKLPQSAARACQGPTFGFIRVALKIKTSELLSAGPGHGVSCVLAATYSNAAAGACGGELVVGVWRRSVPVAGQPGRAARWRAPQKPLGSSSALWPPKRAYAAVWV